jgi:hypothetical protein
VFEKVLLKNKMEKNLDILSGMPPIELTVSPLPV